MGAPVSDVDLITARPTYALDGVKKKPRQIIVGSAGDLSVEYFDGISDTIPATAGQVLNLQPQKILSTTTAADITIVW